jgi:hypothetical protein
VEKYLEVLGCRAEDRLTGFGGTAESVSFDVSGCVQIYLRARIPESGDKRGELPGGNWFDHKRVKVLTNPLVQVPSFNEPPGGAVRESTATNRSGPGTSR